MVDVKFTGYRWCNLSCLVKVVVSFEMVRRTCLVTGDVTSLRP